jgi:FkbM family methyltransferase
MLLDVGANSGQFGKSIRNQGYRGDIISFEPIPEEIEKLKRRSAKDTRWTVEPVALGDHSGHLQLYVSELSVFSSFLTSTSVAAEFDDRSRTVRQVTVPVRTLDEYLPRVIGIPTFLKIDTQGFEQNILSGGKELLSHVAGVQLELPIVHIYDGVWNIEQALASMRDLGFVVAQISYVNMMHNDPTSVLEMDCVFRRASESA